jgi:HAD superfamily phosphoserine phosphatase-like hydrolase
VARRFTAAINNPSAEETLAAEVPFHSHNTLITMTQSALQSQFLESVVSLNPKTATFDCDGTLWSVDAGEGFFSWELEQKLVPDEIVRWARQRYANYKAGEVAEDVMCGEMVTMHRGLREEIVQRACDTFFAQSVAPHIFPEIQKLVRLLRASGCDVWAVSSSNQWIIRSAMRSFGVPRNRILAAEVAIEDGIITDHLIRVPSGPGKPQAIRSVLKSPPDCAFGNAIWDREMLAMSKHPFVINPNPDLEEIALAEGWPIYQPETTNAVRKLRSESA